MMALLVLLGPAGAGAGAEVSFEKHVISTMAGFPYQIFAADVDGDGDSDLLLAGSMLKWYENNGDDPLTFTERTIVNSFDDFQSLVAADLDGDGDTDIVAAFNASLGGDDLVTWYENDGGSPPAFTERTLTTEVDLPWSVFAADLDDDGDVDALSASAFDDKIAWYENDGGSPPAFTQHVLSTEGDRSVYAADLDGDGDIDVLADATPFTAPEKILWFENDGGSPPAFTERVVPAGATIVTVSAADVDGDGDTDMLAASDDPSRVLWYENDGASPPGFTERIIAAHNNILFILAADLDGDTDADVVSANSQGGATDDIFWYENDGGSPPQFIERTLAMEPGSLPKWASGADADGDGDIDLFVAFQNNTTVAWYENGAGIPPIPCADVAAFEARCELPGPALDVDVTLTDTSHDGETVTLDIDGTHRTVTIIGDLASYSELGPAEGLHTVRLIDPPGCVAPLDLECPPPIDTGGHGRIMVGGDCTLVEAMIAANIDFPVGGCTAGSGRDRLVLTEDVLLSEVASSNQEGDNGTPIVISDIQIEGNDFVIERAPGSPQFRMFLVEADGSLGLDSVTVRFGGDGGIKNLGTLVLTNTTVGNNANSGGPGGIENHGEAILRDSLVTYNFGHVGGIGNYDGATLSLMNSTVSLNDSFYHGGLLNHMGGTVYISASSIANNDGYYETAGMRNDGTLFLTGSTVDGNDGGLDSPGVRNSGYLHVSGSTISNTFHNASAVESSGGKIVMVNSTVSGNHSFAYDSPSGLDISGQGYLKNVTIADSEASPAMSIGGKPVFLKNVVIGHTINADNCDSIFSNAIDLGGNLSDDDSCPAFFGELTGLDTVLADNGGPTETHALLPGSSAIEAGGACGLAPDQRGFLRDALCDSGAFELDAEDAVGGLVTGLDGRRAACFNLTTGQLVDIPLDGATAWNCSAAGLVVNSGDQLVQNVSGEAGASPNIGGSTAGQQVDEVVCSNLTTGEAVQFEPQGPDWSCTAQELVVNAGDLIVQRVRGPVP